MTIRAKAIACSLAAALTLGFSGTGAQAQEYWQCAYFARLFSGIQIFGDAWTWWSQASGKYERGSTPQEGAILAFKRSSGMRLGHVAVVSQVLTDRVIQVTHANWSRINGRRGQIEKNVTVVDVSPRGDWSVVKVWYDPLNDLGTTAYPVHGFIYQAQAQYQTARSAQGSAQNAAATVSRVAAAVTPGGAHVQAAAGEAGDRIAALLNDVGGQP